MGTYPPSRRRARRRGTGTPVADIPATTHGYWALVRTAFAFIGGERRWRWWFLGFVSLFNAAMEAVGAALVYLLVALISTPDASITLPLFGDVANYFPGWTPRSIKVLFALGVGAFFIVRAGVVLAQNYVTQRIVNNSKALVAGEMLDGYLSLPYLFHTQRSSAELIRNTYQGTTKLVQGVVLPAISMGTEILLGVSLLVTLILLAPQAMLLTSIGLGITLFFIQRFVRPRLTSLSLENEQASTESIAAIQQALGGIRDIKLLRREDAFARVHLQSRLVIARVGYRSSVLSSLSPIAIETSLILTIVAVFVLATTGEGSVERTLATLAVFAYVGLRLQPILGRMIGFLNTLNKNEAVVDILIRDRTLIRDWQSAVAAEPGLNGSTSTVGTHFSREVRFDGVHFAYTENGPPVLEDITLAIRRGEFIGICGPTGGGKSTLVDLLIGLLQPTAGTISVDGVPLGRRPIWWWDQLGVVSQSVFLIDDTLRNNIAFGEHVDGRIDADRMTRCVERAQLMPVIADLPEGLDTFVGERGVRLSGGQRQRVAIARALYREPEVLVLDEGTSALDGATERALVAAIDEATHERTLIAIAHRISTIRNADRILVVANGRIQDSGTHDELLERNELFRALA
jgi:ABC-type multidrug transport system fused ATPase/permease subunit